MAIPEAHVKPQSAAYHRDQATYHLAYLHAIENGTLDTFVEEWVTASEVAARTRTTVQAANNRLKALLDNGIVERRRSGVLFEYRLIDRPAPAEDGESNRKETEQSAP